MNAHHKLLQSSLLVLTCISINSTALAQTSVSLNDCVGITSATQRLDCYDAVVRSGINFAPAPAPVPALVTVSAPVATTLPQEFGIETIPGGAAPNAAVSDNRIQSRLIGNFKGWWPGLQFKLENGQVWQYDGQHETNFSEQQNPLITIRKSVAGSYWLLVSGETVEAKVRRLK
ncbi:MAG: hypothetical protein V4607_10915 [Pseudomonadota bacterium]